MKAVLLVGLGLLIAILLLGLIELFGSWGILLFVVLVAIADLFYSISKPDWTLLDPETGELLDRYK